MKEVRLEKKISLEHLSAKTRIKKDFLQSIEAGSWDKLPEFPVVMGFVKSIAGALQVRPEVAAALLKRDYPPKKLSINPKPDVSKTFFWSPKLTFWLGVFIVSASVLVYLIYQYVRFVSPPVLNVDAPKDQAIIMESKLKVIGNTSVDAIVKVNNQPVLVDDEGNFSTEIEVTQNTKEVVVIAKSRSGKETIVSRKIEVVLNK